MILVSNICQYQLHLNTSRKNFPRKGDTIPLQGEWHRWTRAVTLVSNFCQIIIYHLHLNTSCQNSPERVTRFPYKGNGIGGRG
ncbi:unnamed protein product, partial [Larinioides sclopetarius]